MLAENQQTPYAMVQNRAGTWLMPSQANWTNIANELTFPSSVASSDWVDVILSKSSTHPLTFRGLWNPFTSACGC